VVIFIRHNLLVRRQTINTINVKYNYENLKKKKKKNKKKKEEERKKRKNKREE
jgi:hypothetical protein